MTTNQKASLALILGTLAGVVTMAMHPTGREVAASLAGGGHGSLNKIAHSMALIAQPLLLIGTLALTLRFTTHRDIAVAAYVLYAWASIGILLATVASGFIATALIERGLHGAADAADAVSHALHYNGLVNQAFAKVFVVFSGLAMLIWSAAMFRSAGFSRGLAIYGTLLGAACVAGVVSGRLGLDIHGFGAVVLGQGIWYIWVAMILRRT